MFSYHGILKVYHHQRKGSKTSHSGSIVKASKNFTERYGNSHSWLLWRQLGDVFMPLMISCMILKAPLANRKLKAIGYRKIYLTSKFSLSYCKLQAPLEISKKWFRDTSWQGCMQLNKRLSKDNSTALNRKCVRDKDVPLGIVCK